MTLEEASEVKNLRLGAHLAQLLFTHKPRKYNFVQGVMSLQLWRQDSSAKVFETLNHYGMSQGKVAARGHVDRIGNDHDSELKVWREQLQVRTLSNASPSQQMEQNYFAPYKFLKNEYISCVLVYHGYMNMRHLLMGPIPSYTTVVISIMPYIHLRQDGWGMTRSADGEKNRQTDTETWSLYNLHTDTYVKTYILTEIKEYFDTYILTLKCPMGLS